jgi:transposase
MAKRRFQLSEQEIQQLGKAEQETRDAYELKRLQAMRLYGSGVERRTIEDLIGCDERSIRKWAQRYTHQGLEGLKSQWQGENALKLSRQQRAELREQLHRYRPDQVMAADVRISRGQFWTVSDMQLVVQQWYGVTYRTVDSYRRLLHECGLSYQQTEKVYRSRPDEQAVADFEAEREKK